MVEASLSFRKSQMRRRSTPSPLFQSCIKERAGTASDFKYGTKGNPNGPLYVIYMGLRPTIIIQSGKMVRAGASVSLAISAIGLIG
jgi:hypothetical protein